MNCNIRSSNWPEAKHNSFSTSVISNPLFSAGIQFTSGTRVMIADMKLRAHILFLKSFGSIPGKTNRSKGKMFVGADGKCSPPEANGLETEVIHINVAVT